MKNIIKGALLLLMVAGTLSSCNLDKEPFDGLPAKTAIVSFGDAETFRTGLYSFARGCFPPDASIAPAFQTEGINATRDYGNFYGFQYRWDFANNDGLIEGLWTTSYSVIFQINFFLEKVALLDREDMTDAQKASLDLYVGEAHFFRAIINRQLATFYCKDYTPATADTDLGIIISKKADIYAREKRSTLEQTYVAISEDIAIAELALNRSQVAGSDYLSPIVVTALKAKVALDTHDYANAAKWSEEIVAAHPLINDATAFKKMWANDTGSEIVFQFYASVEEGAADFGSMFLRDPDGTGGVTLNPAYIPSAWMLGQYEKDNDIRFDAYFRNNNIRIGSTVFKDLYIVNKYPGNPKYNASPRINELKQSVKLYRSADFCLMAAEAYAMNNELGEANKALTKLRQARIKNYVHVDYPAGEIMTEIKWERLKELYMEGNRIADLKRWGDPMSRAGQLPQSEAAVLVSAANSLTISATDKRFVWPIPQSEANSNPAIKGQLNW